MNFNGVFIGIMTFLIIGLCHPLVIKLEYYWGKKCWPVYLISGLICVAISLYIDNATASALLGVAAFSLFWSIHEIFAQEKRVLKGWYPQNPNRQYPTPSLPGSNLHQKLKIPKVFLLLFLFLLWGTAACMVLKTGFTYKPYANAILAIVVFSLFLLMFYRVTKKNYQRIMNYANQVYFYLVLDVKGYITIAIMIGLGFLLRHSPFIPVFFIGSFYLGLGLALAFAALIILFFFYREYIGWKSHLQEAA